MKYFVYLLLVGAVWFAACAPRTGDPAELITVNKQRELQLLGSWRLMQMQDGRAPQQNQTRTLTFSADNQVQMDFWEHRVTLKYEAMPDPDHLRLTWVRSTNPNDKPWDVLVQPFTVSGNELILNGDTYERVALASGATVAPEANPLTAPTGIVNNPAEVRARLNETFDLHVGERAEIIDAPSKLDITFWRVSSESRCPPDVACYWSGEARVEIVFGEDGLQHPPIFELTTNPADPRHSVQLTSLEDYVVELVEVKPQRLNTTPIPQENYIATFRVTNTTKATTTPSSVPTPAVSPTVTAAPPNGLPTMKLDEPFTTRVHQTVWLPEADMQLTINSMLEDSRCPRSVNCVQAGRAVLGLTLVQDQWLGYFTLSTMPPDAERTVYFRGYAVTLLDVTPYPQNLGETIPPQDYVVKLVAGKQDPPTVVHKNEPIVLKPGMSATLADEDVTLTFVRVPSDSRCPYPAACAVQGNAPIEITLRVGDKTTAYTLDTDRTMTARRNQAFGNVAVELLTLNPYPRIDIPGQEIAPGDYEATFVVRKFVSPQGPTQTPMPPSVTACFGMTADDAQKVLGRTVQPAPLPYVKIHAPQKNDATHADAQGVCGFVSAETDGLVHLDASDARIDAPDRAVVYAVTAERLSGVRTLELLRVFEIMHSAVPNADETSLFLMQTYLSAGDLTGALNLFETLAKGTGAIQVQRMSGVGENALWLWRPGKAVHYAALLVPRGNNVILIEALVPQAITPAAAAEALASLPPAAAP